MITQIYSEKIQNNGDSFRSDLNSSTWGENFYMFRTLTARHIHNSLERMARDPLYFRIREDLKS